MEKKTQITTAPNIGDIKSLYSKWENMNPGRGMNDFILFMNTPSQERKVFLIDHTDISHEILDGIVVTTNTIK